MFRGCSLITKCPNKLWQLILDVPVIVKRRHLRLNLSLQSFSDYCVPIKHCFQEAKYPMSITRGSIVLDGPSTLQSLEAIQVLQATPTCHVTCSVTQLLTCCTYQVTAFWKKAKTVGDVNKQMVQCEILNGEPESNVLTQTWQSCDGTSMTFPPHKLIQVRGLLGTIVPLQTCCCIIGSRVTADLSGTILITQACPTMCCIP